MHGATIRFTEESVHLGHHAVLPGKRTLMFLLKCLDLITDCYSAIISKNRSPSFTAAKTSKLTKNVTINEN